MTILSSILASTHSVILSAPEIQTVLIPFLSYSPPRSVTLKLHTSDLWEPVESLVFKGNVNPYMSQIFSID